jgi:hypothetical protein
MERTMNKLKITAIKSFQLDHQQTNIPEHLIQMLYNFLRPYYHLTNQKVFQQLILRPGEKGELIVHYGLNQDIAAFTRTFRQKVLIGRKQVIAYSAFIYLNPIYRSCPTVTGTGLTKAIEYKLANPHEELIYVAFADNPLTYEFFSQLSDSIYPKPTHRVPDQIITVINALKRQNGWISTNSHPMIVNSTLMPIKNQDFNLDEDESALNEFYLSANPHYMQGNSLLVYIPLHLANIGYGLNHQGTSVPGTVNPIQYQGFQDGVSSEHQA